MVAQEILGKIHPTVVTKRFVGPDQRFQVCLPCVTPGVNYLEIRHRIRSAGRQGDTVIDLGIITQQLIAQHTHPTLFRRESPLDDRRYFPSTFPTFPRHVSYLALHISSSRSSLMPNVMLDHLKTEGSFLEFWNSLKNSSIMPWILTILLGTGENSFILVE